MKNFSGLREKCGVFGIIGTGSDLQYCILGLRALQHRGQEASGVAVVDSGQLNCYHSDGLVDELAVFQALGAMSPNRAGAIGHVRYSTSGDKVDSNNVQPIIVEVDGEKIAVAHNGNFTNALAVRRRLESDGAHFKTTMDSEALCLLIQKSSANSLMGRIQEALQEMEGAYSLVIMSKDCIIGVRDKLAIRPLVLGQAGNNFLLASESCAVDAVGATFVRDIEGGEAVIIKAGSNPIYHKKFTGRDSDAQIESVRLFEKVPSKHCIFEYVYFSRPDSIMDGMSVYQARKEVGKRLARKHPVVSADVIAPIPESSLAAALGYAEESGITLDIGVTRNSYVMRTFIQPDDGRSMALCVKHNVNRHVVQGKSVVLVDDSLVRGNTARFIVAQMREFGAREVHMRIASPPVQHCCYYGIDTPDLDQLIAAKVGIKELAKILQLDSLEYVSINDLYLATAGKGRNNDCPQFCDACFTGDYPVKVEDKSVESAPQLSVSSGVVEIEGYCHPHTITSFNIGVLRLEPIFSTAMIDYIKGFPVSGLYIFISDAALLGGTCSSEVDRFLKSCSIVVIDNIGDVLQAVKVEIGIKLCCIVAPDNCVTRCADESYHLRIGEQTSVFVG